MAKNGDGISYAALMGKECLHLVALKSDEFDDAADEVEVLIETREYYDVVWIADIGDLIELARFFGQHRDQFEEELLGERDG